MVIIIFYLYTLKKCLKLNILQLQHFDTCFIILNFFPDVEYVNRINVYITNKYLDGTFNSCNKVSVPSTGQLALDLMCGEWGASRCTPLKWFHFMGDAENNVFVPFQITYINTDNPVGSFTPLDPPVTPCNKALNVSITFLKIYMYKKIYII